MALSQNRIKLLRSLSQKKGRAEHRLYLAEGYRLIRDAIDAEAAIVELFHTEAFAADGEKYSLLAQARRSIPVTEVRDRDLEAFTDTVSAQGVAALIRIEGRDAASLLKRDQGTTLVVAVDAVNDPGNLGTIIRTCDWFGADGILVGKGSADIHQPKVVRATMGSLFHLPIASEVDLPAVFTSARGDGFRIYGADADGGEPYDRFTYPRRLILLFGNEAWGISDAVAACADGRIRIPRVGSGESLNVGVACGVILSAVKRRGG